MSAIFHPRNSNVDDLSKICAVANIAVKLRGASDFRVRLENEVGLLFLLAGFAEHFLEFFERHSSSVGSHLKDEVPS